MQLLIYAFGPYGKNKTNISQQVLDRLNSRPGLQKVVFPVEFKPEIFIKQILKSQPDAILGLGQHSRAKKLRIERRAKNRRGRRGKPSKAIDPQGPSHIAVTLGLKPGVGARISYDAGKYVCNFSMYSLLNDSATKSIPYAFIHIPRDFKLSHATKFIEDKIDEILKSD